MSAVPTKLLHEEEEGHPKSAKRPHEDINTEISNSSGNEHHRLPIERNPDDRMAKIQRIDTSEVEKTSSLPPSQLPSPSIGSSLDHSITSSNRPKLDALKDDHHNRDAKVETREKKVGNREVHNEIKLDPQSGKGESHVRREEPRVDGKEIRSESEPTVDFKPDIKSGKDSSIAANPHLNAKETKEPYRAVKYSESSSDVAGQLRVTQHVLSIPVEKGKETPTSEGQESLNAHGAVAENKIELNSEEKIREKERKKNDDNHNDWAERDKDKQDRNTNLHLTSSSKELSRDYKDVERWDRERKDPNDRERDHTDKTPSNLNERESMNISSIMIEKEHTTLDTKKSKDVDSGKISERENKNKKRSWDHVADTDRQEGKNKEANEKESEAGYIERLGVIERDREISSPSVHQHKRLLRQKGTLQPSLREPRFSSRSRESEGSKEKSEVSSIVYKVGVCMQEILKSWKEYQNSQGSSEDASLQNGPILEIGIPAEHVTATNRQVRAGQLWGTDIYSDDSDLVAVLIHTGYCRPTAIPPPPAIQELQATIRVLPPQACYTSTLRNNVRSRAWSAGITCSFRIEKCCIVKKGGGTINLEPCLTHISAVEPTLAPLSAERTMTTRSAASNAHRHQRLTREVTIQYNLCHEPWMKYSINVVADKGMKKHQYTSARLKKGEVLYLETHSVRYELCFSGERVTGNGNSCAPESTHDKSAAHHSRDHNNTIDVFRWSRCKKVLPQKVMKSVGIPSPIDEVEVLQDNLEWEDLRWSQTGVWVAGKEFPIIRVHFLSKD